MDQRDLAAGQLQLGQRGLQGRAVLHRHRRVRGVMRFERAGRARRARVGKTVRRGRQLVDHGGDRLRADLAGTQQHRAVAGQARQVDDGRFDADLAGSAVEHRPQRAVGAELVAHVLRGGRADVAELVGRRRRDAAAAALEGLQQRDRHRMRRAAQADRVLPAGNGGGNAGGALEDHGQRAGPERGGQLARLRGNLGGPVIEVGAGRQVDDHRMVLRPALGGIDGGDGGRVLCVGAEAVHGLGRKGDDLPGPQRCGESR